MCNVLVQKKQVKPIKLKGVKPKDLMQDERSNMDELAKSTIMLSMSKSVYYNVLDTVTSYEKIVQPLGTEECSVTNLLAEAISGLEDEGWGEHVISFE